MAGRMWPGPRASLLRRTLERPSLLHTSGLFGACGGAVRGAGAHRRLDGQSWSGGLESTPIKADLRLGPFS